MANARKWRVARVARVVVERKLWSDWHDNWSEWWVPHPPYIDIDVDPAIKPQVVDFIHMVCSFLSTFGEICNFPVLPPLFPPPIYPPFDPYYSHYYGPDTYYGDHVLYAYDDVHRVGKRDIAHEEKNGKFHKSGAKKRVQKRDAASQEQETEPDKTDKTDKTEKETDKRFPKHRVEGKHRKKRSEAQLEKAKALRAKLEEMGEQGRSRVRRNVEQIAEKISRRMVEVAKKVAKE